MDFFSPDTSIIDVVAVSIPAVIAGYVAYVAWRQWQTAKKKIRLDLYDRRLQIYEATVNFYNALIGDTDVEGFVEARQKFMNAVRESRFLFSDNSGVHQTLHDLRNKAFEIQGFKTHRKELLIDPYLWIDLHKKMMTNLQKWDESIKNLEAKIARYMNFHDD